MIFAFGDYLCQIRIIRQISGGLQYYVDSKFAFLHRNGHYKNLDLQKVSWNIERS